MGEEPDSSACGDRDIGGAITGVLVAYLRRVAGDEGVLRVLARAGESRTPEQLSDLTTWSPYQQVVALFEAAAVTTGDRDVAQRAGEELLLQYAGTEVAALLRSLGSPVEVLRNIAATASKYSAVTDMEAVGVADGRVLISARTKEGFDRHPHFCAYTRGVLSQATPLFGLPSATVSEIECQTKGDRCCLYEVTWDPTASADDDLESKCAHLESELKALTDRFEALQANAGELVTAGSVDVVLRTVAKRVGLAVRAPQHLLAVRLTPSEPIRVHHNGFATEAAARDAAEDLLARRGTDDSTSQLVVEIATPRSWFGRIAALHPGEMRFFPQERRLLEAYAGHVAAALEAAVALEGAKRESLAARALLGLARELAGVGTAEDVATRLVDAMATLIDCDQRTVLLWDADPSVLRLAASAGMTQEAHEFLQAVPISPTDTAALATMLDGGGPVFLAVDSADDFLRPLFTHANVGSIAAVPIMAGSEFFGVITAGFLDPNRLRNGDPDLLERLSGLADHAASAMQNSQLLTRLHAQALHDALTGLPNARLLEDRVTSAIAQARRDGTILALLFVDFDEFKPVNDTYGHAAGDRVLIEAAHRMRGSLRDGDTIARLAGDEFVILLRGLAGAHDADAVAAKVSEALERPFTVDHETIGISGSIGIAAFPEAATDYSGLLRAADKAMYQAKRRRSSTYAYGHST